MGEGILDTICYEKKRKIKKTDIEDTMKKMEKKEAEAGG